MKRINLWLALLLVVSFVIAVACNAPANKDKQADQTTAKNDSIIADSTGMDESCSKPTKYPNQDKPMALMMRQMADNAQQMKDLVLKGEAITGAQFPFIRFHLVEPTDPEVLQPQFYENARLLQVAHKNMVSAPVAKQKEMYTAYINQCITCHQIYCSGPLKRIKKLTLDYKP